MSDFKELNPPREWCWGWYINTKEGEEGDKAWLTIHGVLSSDTSHLPILCYDSESEAYKSAAAYYNNHGRKYPHAVGTMNDCCESQVMEFI